LSVGHVDPGIATKIVRAGTAAMTGPVNAVRTGDIRDWFCRAHVGLDGGC
jgi:hypothetical protein